MSLKARDRIVMGGQEILYRIGLYGLLHRIRNSRTLTVFMFHRVLPRESDEYRRAEREYTISIDGFGCFLDFVKQHYNVVSLANVIEAGEGVNVLPSCAALITFDDGWRDNFLYALPELKKRLLPAVLFMSTEVVDLAGNRWWQDALVEIFGDSARACQLAQELGHGSPKTASLLELTAMLAKLPLAEREEVVSCFCAHNGVRQMATCTDIDKIDPKWFALAAHGHTHAPLTHMSEIKSEFKTSRDRIRNMGGWYSVMSLPHGAFDENVLESAHDAGFGWIFTSEPSLNSVVTLCKSHQVARIHVPENFWTCDSKGLISGARLANYLFFRPLRYVN